MSKRIPAFNKLVILNPEHADNNTGRPLPIILTKKQNNQCIAYKPESAYATLLVGIN